MPSGVDPMGGNRLSEKDMRQQIDIEHISRSVLQVGPCEARPVGPLSLAGEGSAGLATNTKG
jgi:hypothetical protein